MNSNNNGNGNSVKTGGAPEPEQAERGIVTKTTVQRVEVVVAMLEVALTNARSEVETATSLIAENNVTSPPKFSNSVLKKN